MLASLQKAFRLLDAFTLEAPEWTLADLSARFRMPKPTVHHIMKSLIEAGWVHQDPTTRRYRLGIRLWEKGWLAANQLGLREVARPFVEVLAEQSRETVHLAILDPADPGYVVYIDKVESAHPVRAYSTVGGRAPSYCVATGKAMLAFDPDAVERVLTRRLQAYTLFTLTDSARFCRELAIIQKREFSVNRGEYREDVTGVGACIRNHGAQVVAGVGISGPSYRFPERVIQRMAPVVIGTAREISLQLGFITPDGRRPFREAHRPRRGGADRQ